MPDADLPPIPNPPAEAANPEFLHSATPEEFLPPISRWTSWGGIVLTSIFAATIGLASILKYRIAIKAPATIRPTGELRLVQAATQGTIKSIAMRVNQVVNQGDIIAYMDDFRLQTKKSQLQTNIQQAKLQLSQLDAQLGALDGQIAAQTERNQRSIAISQAELERNQRELLDKQITTNAQVQEASANLRQAQQELQKARAQLKSAQAQLKSIQAALEAAQVKQERYQPLAKSGSISIEQFQEAELAVEQQQQQLASQKAIVEGQQEAIKQQQEAVAAALARLEAAKTAINPSGATVAISQEQIARERAAGKANLARLNQEQQQLRQRKGEINNQSRRDMQELQQIKQEIALTVIRAAAAGTIQELNLRNPQQVLRPGDVIAQIAPSESLLVIKALVPSEEIPNVKMEQSVYLRIAGCAYTDYGTLPGKVTAISPDAFSSASNDSSSTPGKSGTYEVTIQPQSTELISGSRKCVIQSGMKGRADIISSQETVLVFLLRKARLLTDL
ncbi:HlyD family efflux transporter periplasmic adaptor subunit [Calothrix rhizosoleniae]|uniref:HlyD family efflux transporter periplasmic adaptor subunit n=1 Tax=Calothrix rhizosoleniae TaxID=888997 RepID=UPI000B49D976|nr:HlyD family efflux transporter periplasmic adaptor subunit [Calothrix rhizosoleniae]